MEHLHNPSASFEVRVVYNLHLLFSARTDMRYVATTFAMAPITHVTRIEAKVLYNPFVIRTCDDDTVKGEFKELCIVYVRAGHRQCDGKPFPLSQNAAFSPFLLLSVGLLPTSSLPPRGAFVMHPSILCHSQSKPWILSYSSRPFAHILTKNPSATSI